MSIEPAPARTYTLADRASESRDDRASWRVVWWAWGIPLIALAALLGPLVLTSSTFGQDWPNHLWLVWQQSRNITALGHPSYFLQSHLGAFYPFYAFYGGTLYAVVGAGLRSDRRTPSHCLHSFICGGIYRGLRRVQLVEPAGGARGWQAQIPGLIYVGSAYYLTSAYGRGDWPELIATSSLPLVAAGGLYLVRTDVMRVLPSFCYVGAVVTLTGSHVITLVWGATFLLVVAAISCFAFKGSFRRFASEAGVDFGLSGASVGVNLWWLLPAFIYSSHVLIAQHSASVQSLGGGSPNRVAEIFDPLRRNNLGPRPCSRSPRRTRRCRSSRRCGPRSLAIGWRSLGAAWRRIAVGLVCVTVVLLALVMFHQPWLVVPSLWRNVQFVIRLQTYITLAVMGLLMIGTLAIRCERSARTRRALTVGLAAVGVLTAYQACQQVWTLPSVLRNRGVVFANEHTPPPSWYAMDDYADVSQTCPVNPTLGVVPGLTESNGQLSLPLAGPPRRQLRLPIHLAEGRHRVDGYPRRTAAGERRRRASRGANISTNWMVVALPVSAGRSSKLVILRRSSVAGQAGHRRQRPLGAGIGARACMAGCRVGGACGDRRPAINGRDAQLRYRLGYVTYPADGHPRPS